MKQVDELVQLEQMCIALEDLGMMIFENLEEMFDDPTISDLTAVQIRDALDRYHLTQENWGAYDDGDGRLGPDLSATIGRGATQTASSILATAQSSWDGFKRFNDEILVRLDRTGQRDLDETVSALGQYKGEGQGHLTSQSLADSLAVSGQLPRDLAGVIKGLSKISARVVDQLIPHSNGVLKDVSHALEQYQPAQEGSFRTMAAKLTSTVKRIQTLDRLLGSDAMGLMWPGGYRLTRTLTPMRFEQQNALTRIATTNVTDIDLYRARESNQMSGQVPVLRRQSAESLLRELKTFISANRDLAHSVSGGRTSRMDSRYSGVHLANRLRFIVLRETVRGQINDPALFADLRLISTILKRYSYLTPRTVVRQLLTRNLAVIRTCLRYVRQSARQYQ